MILISVPRSSRWVAKLWRSACSVTPLRIPAASAASWNRRLSWRVVIGFAGPLAGKQPAFRHGSRGIETPPARLPPLAQQVERLGRQHDIAVLAALGLFDPNDLLRAVDMLDLQPDHLAGAQATAIAETEQHAQLEAARDRQQAPRLVLAHHQRNPLRLPKVKNLGRKVQTPQRPAT